MRAKLIWRCAVPAILALAWCLHCPAARAASSDPVSSARMTARLVTDVDAYVPGQPFRVGLQLTAAPGWHSYWRNPGDAGAATEFTVAAGGAATGAIAWPLPDRIEDHGIVSFGYTAPVLLARSVTASGGGGLTLNATANWLVCRTVCVPEQARFSLVLPTGAPVASVERPLFDAAAASVPADPRWAARIAPDGTLGVPGIGARPAAAMFLPDESDRTVLDASQAIGWRAGLLTVKLTPTANFHPDRVLSGVLVLGAGAGRVGYQVAATPGPAAAATPETPSRVAGLALTLLLAVAGGLLLNAMPCVFPVLAIKAVGIARLGGQHRDEVRREALAYTAGVMLSFLGLAALLLALRAAGSQLGWGFQFQWPGFVAAMAWLFFAVGLNLSGVFTLGGGWMGAGQGLTERGGLLGSFATGLLAVLVATPCTAPFMGVAMAAAVAAPAAEALAVFVALGAGFALPWLLLAAIPGAAARLPRPGAWMEHLRQFLAFPMYAAAVWLVWVLSQQAGSGAVLGAGAGFVLIAFGLWILRLTSGGGGVSRQGGLALALACLLAALAMLPGISRGAAPPLDTVAGGQPYSATALLAARQAGRPVLVNMTAAWCVTCLVNERAAIRPALPRLLAHRVVYLTGEWTRRDPAITAFLRQYGRDGVPLYVFFAAVTAPDEPGRVLPQILTPSLLASLAP